jgi:hypothetical protein
MKVIPASKWRTRDVCLAAWGTLDFDELMKKLATKPNSGTVRASAMSPMKYRFKYLSLSTGRFACLSEHELKPNRVEIELEVRREFHFYEADLLEVLDALGINVSAVARVSGGFKWIPAK